MSLIDYRKDGRIAIEFDGKPIVLRVIKIKEFEEMLKYADELDDELEAFSDIRKRAVDPELRESNPISNTEMIDYMQTRRMVAAKFAQKAVTLLGDRPPPEELEDYPAFLMDLALPARFQAHWQTAPLGSSDPATSPT